MLNESSEARRLAVSLKGVAYGDQLVDQLFAHSTKMEKLFEAVNNLLKQGSNNDGKYEKFVETYKQNSAWFEKAKARFVYLNKGFTSQGPMSEVPTHVFSPLV